MRKRMKIFLIVSFLMLPMLLTACTSKYQQNTIICENQPFNEYRGILKAALPSCNIASQESDIFVYLNKGAAVEAFDAQAIPSHENGVALFWYPEYLATVVIAVDRDRSSAEIKSWADLGNCGERISMPGNTPYSGYVLAAVSYGIDGENFSLHHAAKLLEPIYRAKNLVFDDYNAPVLICFDYQAAALINSGRNLEIIVPSEGTLSFEKGLLSKEPIDMPDNRAVLINAGFRPVARQSDGYVYPDDSANNAANIGTYDKAVVLEDYMHLNIETINTLRIMRREIQGTYRYSSADGQEHQFVALIYIVAVILWTGSVSHRAMQKGVRRSAFICSALLVGWVLVRIFKYQIDTEGIMSRYSWYAYYIFELSIPLVLLWMALVIDKTENTLRPPGWWSYLSGINTALVLLVLTNDIHQLAFVMDIEGGNWSGDYSYGPVYFAAIFVIFAQVLVSQIIMVRKCRHSPRKRVFLLPALLYLVLGIYGAAYIMRIPFAWESSLTITVGIFALIYMEVCVQIGLVPVNRKYRMFFEQSPQNMQIINDEGNMVLTSAQAQPVDEAVWQGFKERPDEPLLVNADDLLFAERINGGMVIWREDIGSINRLHQGIEASMKQLRMANILLEREESIRSRLASSQARTSLFEALENKIRQQSEKLSYMLHNIPDGEARSLYIARVTLLVCYIKRRCNLFFIEQNSEETSANELIVYMDELAEFARVIGLKCFCNSTLTRKVSLRQVTLMYDLFYSLLDWLQNHGNISLLLQIVEENSNIVMRIMPSDDMSDFSPEREMLEEIEAAGGEFVRKPLYDADGFWLTFS